MPFRALTCSSAMTRKKFRVLGRITIERIEFLPSFAMTSFFVASIIPCTSPAEGNKFALELAGCTDGAKYIFVTGGVVSSLGKGVAAPPLDVSSKVAALKSRCKNATPT